MMVLPTCKVALYSLHTTLFIKDSTDTSAFCPDVTGCMCAPCRYSCSVGRRCINTLYCGREEVDRPGSGAVQARRLWRRRTPSARAIRLRQESRRDGRCHYVDERHVRTPDTRRRAFFACRPSRHARRVVSADARRSYAGVFPPLPYLLASRPPGAHHRPLGVSADVTPLLERTFLQRRLIPVAVSHSPGQLHHRSACLYLPVVQTYAGTSPAINNVCPRRSCG